MKNSQSIRALIIDDEPLARKRIRSLLKNYPEFEIVGECNNGHDAAQVIQANAPDLIFLDVQMPGMDGLTLVKTLTPELMPLVIFVTAFENYGLAAFDAYAVDYLLKPFDEERFEKALRQAKSRFAMNQSDESPADLAAAALSLGGEARYLKYFAVRSKGRVFLVKTETIDWIEAERNQVRLHVGQEFHLRREAIGNIEKQLDPAQFRRIHRSAIVNMNAVKELRSSASGEYQVVLKNGTNLVLSRKYQSNLYEFLG
ncbi:MAG: LytTR family DNA-binding domain-containing protein [Acidobacteriota bacterium]|nr:LytTR family DNA-binding domain-containing protein [Acidobacteriota bacterium]